MDIFTLGSCLYEMMTLHHLPPGTMSQPEYKNMLAMGKRPQITHKVRRERERVGEQEREALRLNNVGGVGAEYKGGAE